MTLSTFLLLLFLSPLATQSYDIGCLYPPNAPDPFAVASGITRPLSLSALTAGLETPIIIHGAGLFGACSSNCNAYHDPVALNVLTQRPTNFVTPPFGHNSFSRVLCFAQCADILATTGGTRNPVFVPLLETWGLSVTAVDPELALILRKKDTEALGRFLVRKDYHPFVIGQIVALEIAAHSRDDGWNSAGNLRFDAAANTVVNCTANCSAYSDTTGYAPAPAAPLPTDTDTDCAGKEGAKYECTGACKSWQPLVDYDPLSGAFKAQTHVTPHIGRTARLLLSGSMKSAPDPAYDYRAEGLRVVEEARATAQENVRKESIRLFDSKLTVRGLIQERMKTQFAASHTYERHILYIRALDVVENDAIIQLWKEKRKWDLVRPTTYIQRWGGDELLTFNGDRQSAGPELISTRDFQAWQRVMPHSEYPSASAGLCQGYQEVTDAFVSGEFGDVPEMSDLAFGPGGFQFDPRCDEINLVPGKEPPTACSAVPLTFKNMEEVKDVCGQSRLWGALHFRASVKAGQQLCDGLGRRAYNYVKKAENGSTWTSSYKKGDPFPVCGSNYQFLQLGPPK